MTDIFLFLQIYPLLSYCIATLFFLLVGSFLNVVIYRLPLMLSTRYAQECLEYLEQTPAEPSVQEPFNLAWPGSHCPHCKHPLRPWHNIPLVSFIVQKGKCAFCQHPISWQYPTVELLTAVSSLVCLFHFGFNVQGACALIFTYFLICMSVIDFHHYILPDELTLSLLWFGLLLSTATIFCSSTEAIVGAAVGYGVFASIQYVYGLITGKIGLGQGDHKLVAALAAFSGWQVLPVLLLIAALLGLAGAGVRAIQGLSVRHHPIPFGPALACSGWICILQKPLLLSFF